MIWKIEKDLLVGDLVYHVLYGKDWLGVVLRLSMRESSVRCFKEGALVQMVPGTKYENFFNKKPKITRKTDTQGWVSKNWLIKIS